jgi:hypothetical protein
MPIAPLRTIALALFALVSVALIAAVPPPPAAHAAALGPGYEYHGQAGSHLGGYLDPDGSISYCINAGAPSTVGKTTTDVGIVGSVNGLSENTMIQLNELLSAHGNTADDTTAAAVAMAVWSIAGPADYNAEGGDLYVLGRAPVAVRPAIQALADQFRAEANAYSRPTGSATLSLSIDPANNFAGSVAVSAPLATGTITLTNAVFADTRNAVRSGVGDGERLAIRATPPTAKPDTQPGVQPRNQLGGQPYRVTANADFTGPPAPSANVHLYATPGSQTLSAAGTSAPITFSATATDTADRTVPAATTTAQATAVVGGTVIDTAHLTNVPSSGEQLTWEGFLQGSDAASCTDKNRVFTSASPLTVTHDGDYSSEPFAVTSEQVGRIAWILTLKLDGEVISAGTCGDATELSVLAPAPQHAALHLPVVSG